MNNLGINPDNDVKVENEITAALHPIISVIRKRHAHLLVSELLSHYALAHVPFVFGVLSG